jgi:hypothetical protein
MGAPTTLGCQTHECDPDFICIDGSGSGVDCTAEGGVLAGQTPIAISGYTTSVTTIATVGGGAELVWDTSSLDGPWLDYPANQTYIINFPPGLAGHLPTSVPQALVSADNPGDASPHQNFIDGPGYLVEFSNVTPYQMTVHNPTCAHYSLRLEVRADVSSDAESVVDAASGADATNVLDATIALDAASGADATNVLDAASAADAGSAE